MNRYFSHLTRILLLAIFATSIVSSISQKTEDSIEKNKKLTKSSKESNLTLSNSLPTDNHNSLEIPHDQERELKDRKLRRRRKKRRRKKRRSPSSKRRSSKSKRRSSKRRSPKRKSSKRKSSKRRSTRRRSSKRRTPKRKPKRKLRRRSRRSNRRLYSRYRPVSYYTKRKEKYEREHGCILTAEFGHFFYNLLTRSADFTIRYFSNCGNIPEITYRVYYENNTFINWYNHPTEVYLNIFNNIYKLEFRKPKQINTFDITKSLMYQEMQIWGMKKELKPIDLNFDNQIWLQKQHIFGFEPNNIKKLTRQTTPLPCFVRREMVKNWKKIIKKKLLLKKQKAKAMKMMMEMMAKNNQGGRRLSLLNDVPGMKGIINQKLYKSAGRVHLRREKINSMKRNLRLVKRKHQSIGRSLRLINSGSPIPRNLKVDPKAKPATKKDSKSKTTPKKKSTKKSGKKVKKPSKQEKFMKMVKKVSEMKYKMNKELLQKKMKKKLIKGYYLLCASP